MMTWINDHWIPLLFVVGYLAILAWHGWRARQRTKDLADYLIAGRSLGGWAVALSFYATFVSTNTFIGHAGKSWDVGLIWYVKLLAFAVFCILAWFLIAPRFVALARQYDSLTVSDFLEHRYGSRLLRRLAAIVILIASVFYIVAVYNGSSLALEQFLGLDYRIAAVAVFAVVTAYTLAGGFHSVVMTDVVQALLMAIGAVGLVTAVFIRGGGPVELFEKLTEYDPEMVSWEGKMPLLTVLGLAIAGGIKMIVDPRQLSRFYGLRDDAALRQGRFLAPLLIVITYLCVLPIGAFSHVLIPADAVPDSDHVVPHLLGTMQIFGPVLSSLFLLVLISAAMSSLDSVLLVAASSVSRDLFILKDDDPRALPRTRGWVFTLSLAGMLLALNPWGDIVEITAFSGSLYAACFLPTLVIGLFWKGGTAKGAVLSVALGSATVVGWYCAKKAGWTSLHEVYVGLGVALVVYFVASLVSFDSVGDQLKSQHPKDINNYDV